MSDQHSKILDRLKRSGLTLPPTAAPLANYVPAVIHQNSLYISGQLPFVTAGGLPSDYIGQVGASVQPDIAYAAARQCVLNILTQVQSVLGDFNRLSRCLRLGGFIACTPEYTALAAVMNGASDTMVELLGEAGRHVRSTVGVAQLPLGVCCEVDAIFALNVESHAGS